MSVLTIRDVPEDVKDALAQDARSHGQSLQAFLLSVLTRQAQFARNRQLLTEIEHELAAGGSATEDAPDSAELLEQARTGRNGRDGNDAPGDVGGAA